MAVSVAEYLGQRTDHTGIQIIPVDAKSGAKCPFMDRACDKVTKGNHPVCSVRKSDDSLWIVCEHRLCSTRQTEKRLVQSEHDPSKSKERNIQIPLVSHQVDILYQVAETVYGKNIKKADIGVKREVTIPLEDNNYHADYVMRNFTLGSKIDEILLEMQGGGETSSTGAITRQVEAWSKMSNPTNQFLSQTVKKANPIETNAWRRQQEQFLVKGNVVNQTGGKIVFAVGNLLYDYLQKRFKNANLRDLRKHNWTLCIMAFVEDKSNKNISQGPIPLIVDDERLLFTNYSTFVRFLTDQGGPCTAIFEGTFSLLNGNEKIV